MSRHVLISHAKKQHEERIAMCIKDYLEKINDIRQQTDAEYQVHT